LVAVSSVAGVVYVGLHGNPGPAALLLVTLIPIAVTAALATAYRGRARLQLIYFGADTPFGNPGPLLFLAWYFGSPATGVGAATAVVSVVVSSQPHRAGAAALPAVLIAAGAAFVCLAWAGGRARRLALGES
jgi:hypothetical protein